MKTRNQKKKKSASDQLSTYRSQTQLAKNVLPDFPAGVPVPRVATTAPGPAPRSLVLRIMVVSVTRHEADLWSQEILKT